MITGGRKAGAEMAQRTLEQFEKDLRRIPGVRRARIVGDGQPTEIHILARRGRPAKHIVRDVESLATAGFGLTLDRRIISVVQLDEERTEASTGRLVLDSVVSGRDDAGEWVRVFLSWPDGARTHGEARVATPEREIRLDPDAAGADWSAPPGARPEARAAAAARAAISALRPHLTRRGACLSLEHLVVQRFGSEDSVVLRTAYRVEGTEVTLMGSALAYDDVVAAGARALLHAVNRKLG